MCGQKPNKSEGFAPSKLASTPQIVVQNFQQLLLKRKGKKKNNQHVQQRSFLCFHRWPILKKEKSNKKKTAQNVFF